MKRNLKIFFALLLSYICAFADMDAYAESLNVAPFLKEEFAANPEVTMVSMSGRQAKWEGLTLYKSVSVAGDAAKADAMAKAVRKDGVKAGFKETSYKDGKLYFGFYGLGGEGVNRKYLFYLDMRPKGVDKTTLIYIEGDWSAEEVKGMITKKMK